MKSRILWKFFATVFFLISLTLLVLSFYLTPRLTDLLSENIEETLIEKASLTRDRLEAVPASEWTPAGIDPISDRISGEIRVRVTILDPQGRVLGDSDLNGEALMMVENHLHRPEIQEAAHAAHGKSSRYSTTVGTGMMYVAMKASHGFVRVALPLHAIDRATGQIRRSIFIASLIALALVGVIGFFLSRYLSRPLQDMAEATRRIACGDFSRRLHPASRDELGSLAENINGMAASLQKQFSELETEKKQLRTILDGMVEGVMVTDDQGEIVLINPALRSLLQIQTDPVGKRVLECCRNQALHELVNHVLQRSEAEEGEMTLQLGSDEKNLLAHCAPLATSEGFQGTVSVFYDVTRLRKLELVRKEFVANVSHELKTPLTNILGYAETLGRGALSDGESSVRFVAKIENNAVQLKNLVEDILQLSAIESGRVEMKKIAVVVQDVVESIRNSMEDPLKTRQLSLVNEIPRTLSIEADPSALRQILVNLIDNAIKYTLDGGRITVASEEKDGAVRIFVKDTGIGISEKDLPHVFERFYRVDKARSRQMGGTGLGLAIVKHLVQVHGGEVGVESEVGKGTRFFFSLPS